MKIFNVVIAALSVIGHSANAQAPAVVNKSDVSFHPSVDDDLVRRGLRFIALHVILGNIVLSAFTEH